MLHGQFLEPKTECPRTKMQSRCLNTNITKATFPAPHIDGARGNKIMGTAAQDVR